MTIHHIAYQHATVAAAISEAAAIVTGWRESPGNDPEGVLLPGWPAVDLVERIATALLEARGFDIDGLNDAVGSCREGEEADVLGAWPQQA